MVAQYTIMGVALYVYYTRRFRVDKNLINLALFVPANYYIARCYAQSITRNPAEMAVEINNYREELHQARMGKTVELPDY